MCVGWGALDHRNERALCLYSILAMQRGPDDRSARILAENAGFEIVEVDDRVWFFDRRIRGPTIAAAVSGGVGAIALVNAMLLTTSTLTGGELGGSWLAVAIVFALALAGIGVCSLSLKLRRRRVERPRAELRPLAILDRAAGMLLDADGREIAPVAQVCGGRGMLVGSSAPAVFLKPPERGRIEIYRGSLVGGRLDDVLRVLAELGFSR